jgi:tripartite-type tricarboxylate transporter receptor subunit TctC
MPYDPARDLAPITGVAGSPSVIVAGASVPAASLPEFIAWVTANPKKVAYASSAVGSIAHFGGEYLNQNAGLDLLHVPYKGGAGSIASVLAGETAITFAGTAPILGHVQAGKLKALAVTGDKRIAVLPEVPTTTEAGVPGMSFVNWFGLFAPAGMPDDAQERLNRDVVEVLRQPEVVADFGKLGFATMPMTRAQFAAYIANEAAMYRRVAQAAKLQPE